jgi:hypothetical protein
VPPVVGDIMRAEGDQSSLGNAVYSLDRSLAYFITPVRFRWISHLESLEAEPLTLLIMPMGVLTHQRSLNPERLNLFFLFN